MHIGMTVNAAWNIWNFRRPLVEALLADGHSVTILAPPDDSAAKLEALGCRFVPLDMDIKGLSPVRDFALMLRLRRHFETLRPDAVLSFTIKNNIFGALAAKSLGVAFIPNVTGLGTAFLSGGLLQNVAEWLYRLAFARLPVIFFQNADDRSLFLSRRLVRETQARLLPGSGIDLDHFAAAPYPADDAPRFLLIARLLRDKGVFEYVEAARTIRAERPDARFQILGAIGSENRTAIDAAMLAGWLAEGMVEHLGSTDDVRPFIADTHCVVLPSYREGAPRTLIEAAATARPLIATDVPGCRAVVEDGRTGFLCEARSGQSLADACRRFLALPHERKREMGLAGRAKMASEFDQSIVIDAYRRALGSLRG